MAFTAGGNEGALNSTTEVTIVSSPGASTQRVIRTINIHNKDTASVSLIVSHKKSSTLRRIKKVTLEPDDTWESTQVYVLDATDESIVAVLGGAITTNQPEYVVSYADQS